jgi:hypothetical protein
MRGRAGVGLTAIGVAAAVLVASQPSAAFKDVPPRCKFRNGVVTIDPGYWQPTVERRGDRIVPTYARGEVACKPTSPTVANTDTIVMPDESTIDLRGGPFAPGASPEADGSPEIEFEISGYDYPVDLFLGGGDDHLTAGVLGARSLGINLNPSDADTDADVVLTSDELRDANVSIHGGAGDDVIDTGGGPGFDARSRVSIGLLHGDAGDDTLIGADGYDFIVGGAGSDTIDGRKKADMIKTRDKSRDVVACGPGRDVLRRDRRDRATACERNYLPGQEPPGPKPPPFP